MIPKNVLFILTGMLVACAAGAGTKVVAWAQFPPSVSAHRWQQFCEDDVNHEKVSDLVRAQGAQGWEIASVTTIAHSYGMTVCFKRPE